jgi:uncharacterized protein (DUF924 family)
MRRDNRSMTRQLASSADVVRFWRDAGPQKWFRKDPDFDRAFRDRFLASHEAAASGQLRAWGDSADGALALVLLLDQFPRNAFRDTPRMYATDAQARSAADQAIAAGLDRQVEAELRPFFYMPLMHSEDVRDLDRCVACMEPVGGESLRFAKQHRDIVTRFNRFPHRNAVLGRASTAEEERFLAEGGFGG